ncbi:hypothetical protein A3850_010755 [Lewinella sp. 4G2]|nr:hypothetical protein A3850_010755 [Lewinella sp. 4G2]
MVIFNLKQVQQLILQLQTMWRGTISKVINIILLAVLTSCSPNYRNVELIGTVFDEANGKIVQNAQVKVVWWTYDMSTAAWESRKTEEVLYTNTRGEFSSKIDKAQSFDVEVFLSDGRTSEYAENLTNNKTSIRITIQ